MNPPAAVDTIVLIRAIREEPDPKEPKAVERAKALIKKLRDDKRPIVLPAVALAEYLAGTPAGDVAENVREISDNFVVEPFDGLAALFAGQIWRDHHEIMVAKNYGTGKQCLKADLYIFATALAKRVPVLYAEDRWFSTVARKYPQIEVKSIPKMADRQKPIAGVEEAE